MDSQADPVTAFLQNIPNIISVCRLVLVPLAIWLLIEGNFGGAFWVFLIAGISDALDGFIAKTFNAETRLGTILDPLADKALLVGVYVTLGVLGLVPTWLVILVAFRDLLIVSGVVLSFMLGDEVTIPKPLVFSKVNTAAQIVLVALLLGGNAFGFGLGVGALSDIMIPVVAATTLVSGAVYVVRWLRSAIGADAN